MEEVIKTKICVSCTLQKPIDSFSDRPTAKDGKRSQCKQCIYTNKKRLNICGIYKITSPTGKIYIGQSKDIKNRWCSYRTRECPDQPIINKSLIKYGWEAHTFEIIEECPAENLNIRERYWQEFYDVTGKNGLNCVLVSINNNKSNGQKKKRKKPDPSIIPNYLTDILDVDTGVFIYGIPQASFHSGVPASHLYDMLRGKAFNKTNLIKGEDYEEGKLPKTMFERKKEKTRVKIKEGLQVVDSNTGEIIGDTATVSKMLGMVETTLRAQLNGYSRNRTSFIYKKDFDKGLSPVDLCSNEVQEIACINPITGEIFETITEASVSLNLKAPTLSNYLKGRVKHKMYPIVKLQDYDPNVEYVFQERKDRVKREPKEKSVKRNKEVINTLTGETYSSMRKLGTILGVPKTTIMKKLNNGGYNEYKLK